MGFDLHAAAAGVYLGAAVAATFSVALRASRAGRLALLLLAGGALLHTAAFVQLHEREPTPSLTSLPAAVSVSTWIAVLFFLLCLRFLRLGALAVLVAPAAFLGAFFASLSLGPPPPAAGPESPVWSHAHVLLASGGLALLGIAGAAGLLYLAHHRRIKAKRGPIGGIPLPPLEALDRVNVFSVAVGFLLLSLGVLTGVLWVHAAEGRLWPGTLHANATLLAWAVYALLLFARFGARQGARHSAANAVAGFALLFLVVVGVGLLT